MHDAPVRMTGHLNALRQGLISFDVAAHTITGVDAAHHVIDPDDLLGLDALHAISLPDALTAIVPREPEGWLLALPVPGALGALRGPRELNEAALQCGSAVVGLSGSCGLVPYDVGPAVQWRVYRAAPPFPPEGRSEAERVLNQTVLAAADALATLDVAAGTRPDLNQIRDPRVELAPGYPRRHQVAADRAARLLEACELALADDGAALSVFQADGRRRELTSLQTAARNALVAAVSWSDHP